MKKRPPIGSEVIVTGCHAGLHNLRHVCNAQCVDTDEPAIVVEHSRDAIGPLTRVRFISGHVETWRRGAIRPRITRKKAS